MKQFLFSVLLASLFFTSCTEKQVTIDPDTIDNVDDSLSYALGLNICESFQSQDVDIDLDIMMQGFKDLRDSTATWNMDEVLMFLQREMGKRSQAKIEKERAKMGGNNPGQQNPEMQQDVEQLKAEGRNWLIENSTKPNVKQTASGLQYQVIKEGTGKHPVASDQVTVHYTGTLIDGTKFDSSVDRGQPATFGLQQVIKGWTEGIPLMKEGGKMRLFIPENLAYGPGRPGGPIPPFATLIFDVELISIAK